MVRTPYEIALRISSSDLLFPCISILAGGKFVATATASSPPVQTSIPIPTPSTQRAISLARKDFAA